MNIKKDEYIPLGACLDIFKYKAPYFVLCGPRASGKTLACLNKLYATLDKFPGCRALLIRRTRKSLTDTVLPTWEEKVIPKIPVGSTEYNMLEHGGTRKGRHSYVLGNGSELVLAGVANIAGYTSSEFSTIMVSQAEELTETDFGQLKGMLRQTRPDGSSVVQYNQIIMECNPDRTNHWLLNRSDIKMFKATHKDNPAYYNLKKGEYTKLGKEYIEENLKNLTGCWRARWYLGEWSDPTGQIYENFDPKIHVCRIQKIVDNNYKVNNVDVEMVRYVAGVDFGFKPSPTTILVFGLDKNDCVYLLREFYKTEQVISDIVKECQKLQSEFSIDTWICDSASNDKIQDLKNAGLSAKPISKKTIIHGIEIVKRRLTENTLKISDTCLISEDKELKRKAKCTTIIEEFQAYIWSDKKDDTPKKENDHSLDALRYVCEFLNRGLTIYTPGMEPDAKIEDGVLQTSYEDINMDTELDIDNPSLWR